MEKREYTIYSFDELSDSAKERARNWLREAHAGDNYFSEYVLEDASKIASILGINLNQTPVKLMVDGTRYEPTIYWSGFGSQGDGACFEGSYSYAKGAAKKIRAYAPSDTKLHAIADALQDIQRRNFYRLQASISNRGRYHFMDVDVETTNGDSVPSETEEAIGEAMRDFAHWIYKSLQAEYEYQNSDEQIDESIRANEYTFDESGNRED